MSFSNTVPHNTCCTYVRLLDNAAGIRNLEYRGYLLNFTRLNLFQLLLPLCNNSLLNIYLYRELMSLAIIV